MAEALLDLPAVVLLGARVDPLQERAGFLGLAAGLLDVDLLGLHGVVDEDERAVLLHLEVAGPGRERLPVPARLDADLARLQHGHERRVSREDADLPRDPRHDQHLGLALVRRALRRHEREVEGADCAFLRCHRGSPLDRCGLRLELLRGLGLGVFLRLRLGRLVLARQRLGALDGLLDGADHVEGLLRTARRACPR